jgi:hypothetical protein
MSRYRKLDPRFWRDEKVRQFDAADKLIAVYAFTGQSNRIGCFTFSEGMATEDTGLASKRWGKRFGNVCQRLGWRYDKANRILYIPTWWKYNQPENGNVLISNLRDLDELPDSPVVTEFCRNVSCLREDLRETFRDTLAKRYPKRLAHQEQEQEQENTPSSPPRGDAREWDASRPHESLAKPIPGGETIHRGRNGGPPSPGRQRTRRVLTPEQQARFAEFWAVYPRHAAKLRAEEAWATLAPDDVLTARIRAAVAARAESHEWREPRFIPYPATWLNGRRWEDELPVADPDPYARLPRYSDADFDARGDLRPEAAGREAARIAARRP